MTFARPKNGLQRNTYVFLAFLTLSVLIPFAQAGEIHDAVRAEAIDRLLDHGAKLDVRNSINETPLSWPLVNGFPGITEKLWPRAEALKSRALLENYPLHRMACHGNAAGAAFLLGKGLPIDSKDESGRTPFQRAAQGGSIELAQILLDKGTKVDSPDSEGSAPLHLAVKASVGMDVFTVNDEHDTVPEVAYLVKADGLTIYHSGDYVGPVDGYAADMEYLSAKAGVVGLAFIGPFKQAESLKPQVVFPIHAWDREYMYGAFAREAAEKKLPSRVICPENRGDRFMVLGRERNKS